MNNLTPEERAYEDALADAVEVGVYGEDALEYADRMRKTLWFAVRTLHYAGADFVSSLNETEIAKRLRALVSRRL